MNERIYEKELIFYSTLYKLLGVIELTLRHRIPNTLSVIARKRGFIYWFEVIPESSSRGKVMRNLKQEVEEGLFDPNFFIPLSFWRYLFSKDSYTTLWLPALYKIFPNFRNPLSRESFQEISDALHRVNLVRNRVAHYDFKNCQNFEIEAALLLWVIAMLGAQDYLIEA